MAPVLTVPVVSPCWFRAAASLPAAPSLPEELTMSMVLVGGGGELVRSVKLLCTTERIWFGSIRLTSCPSSAP